MIAEAIIVTIAGDLRQPRATLRLLASGFRSTTLSKEMRREEGRMSH